MKKTNTAKYIPDNITIRTFEELEGEVKIALSWAWEGSYWDGEKHHLPENLPNIKGVPAFPIDAVQKRSTSFNNWIPYSKFHADTTKPVEITFENTPKDGYRVIDMSWRKDDLAWRVLSTDGRIYDLRNDTFTELFFSGRIGQDGVIQPKLQFVKNGSQMRLEDTTSYRYSQYLTTENRAVAQADNKELRKQHEKNRRAARIREKDLVPGRIYSMDFDGFAPWLYLGKDAGNRLMWIYLHYVEYNMSYLYFHNLGRNFTTTELRQKVLTQEFFFELFDRKVETLHEQLTNQIDLSKKGQYGKFYMSRDVRELAGSLQLDDEKKCRNVWPAQQTLYDIQVEQLEKFRKFFEEANSHR